MLSLTAIEYMGSDSALFTGEMKKTIQLSRNRATSTLDAAKALEERKKPITLSEALGLGRPLMTPKFHFQLRKHSIHRPYQPTPPKLQHIHAKALLDGLGT